MKKTIWVLLLITLGLSNISFAVEVKQGSQFIVLSDIHFDPFLSCGKRKPCDVIMKLKKLPASQWRNVLRKQPGKLYQYQQNASYALLKSTLSEAGQVAKESSSGFVLVLGDSLAHDLRRQYKRYTLDYSRAGYQSFVRKVLQFVSFELSQAFPKKNIYNIVGNNDSYYFDYTVYPGSSFFRDTAITWSRLLQSAAARSVMRRQFAYAGYYAVSITPRLRLIAMNSVLFSTKVTGRGVSHAAQKQLDWLVDELKKASIKNQRVFIAMHIPSGIDIYAHLNYRFLRLLEFWKHDDVVKFEEILQQYAPELVAIFVGHLHRDWFQMLTLNNHNSIPVLGTPAISPIYGNNPGFKLYRYLPAHGEIVNFETFHLPLSSKEGWRAALRMNHAGVKQCQYKVDRHILGYQSLSSMSMQARMPENHSSGVWSRFYQCSVA